MAAIKCKDHLGNEFNSVKEMCLFWGILEPNTYRDRIKRGWSVEEALTGNRNTLIAPGAVQCYDHLGNPYPSKKAMYRHYNIPKNVAEYRLDAGWSLEDTLTMPVGAKALNKHCTDHEGNEYPSKAAMCKAWGVAVGTFNYRLAKGYSVEQALTESSTHGKCFDHLGYEFPSKREMCEFYHISPFRLWSRIHDLGWSLEKALTTPIRLQDGSLKRQLEENGLTYSCYKTRIRQCGYTKEQAATYPKGASLGERKVMEVLDGYGILYIHDKTVKHIFRLFDLGETVDWEDFLTTLANASFKVGLPWSRKQVEQLKPDFFLYTKENGVMGIIEFDGSPHFEFVKCFHKTIIKFLYRCSCDDIKDNLWEYLGIPMLRIKYSQADRVQEIISDFLRRPEWYVHNHNPFLSCEEYYQDREETQRKLAVFSA